MFSIYSPERHIEKEMNKWYLETNYEPKKAGFGFKTLATSTILLGMQKVNKDQRMQQGLNLAAILLRCRSDLRN